MSFTTWALNINLLLASCQSDAECGLSEQCLQGQCNNPCERQGACGLNANCKVFNHVKHCSCPAGFTGGSEIECVRSMYLNVNILSHLYLFIFLFFSTCCL